MTTRDSARRRTWKVIWRAALCPGAGHWYLGVRKRGDLILAAGTLLVPLPVLAVAVAGLPLQLHAYLFAFVLAGLAFHLLQILDAHSLAKRGIRPSRSQVTWDRRYRPEHDLIFMSLIAILIAILLRAPILHETGEIARHGVAIIIWVVLLLALTVGVAVERYRTLAAARPKGRERAELRVRRRRRKRRKPRAPGGQTLRRTPYRERKDYDLDDEI